MMEHSHSTTAGRSAATNYAPTLRGSVGLACLLVGALLAVSYPVFALGVVLGVLGTIAVSRLFAILDERRRSRSRRQSSRRPRTRRSQPE